MGGDAISLHSAQSNWAQAQSQDPATSLVYDRQLHGQRKPRAQEMSSQCREAHTLWSFWDRLFLRDNVLFFQSALYYHRPARRAPSRNYTSNRVMQDKTRPESRPEKILDTKLTARCTTSRERVLHLPITQGRPSDPQSTITAYRDGVP